MDPLTQNNQPQQPLPAEAAGAFSGGSTTGQPSFKPAGTAAPVGQPAAVQTPNTASTVPPGLDPQIVTLAKAIRQQESGNRFDEKGASGEYGAYQFTNDTWNGAAKKFGLDVPLEQATPEQQNEVAYKQLADWKQEHPEWNIGNFASAWNAGEGRPNAYQENFRGTNSYGVHYDTPAYAEAVAKNYQQLKAQDPQPSQGQQPTDPADQSQQPAKADTLGSDLSGRASDALQGINSIVGGEKTGSSRLSGVIQTAGALAGAAGDVVNKGLELIPGVKWLEGQIGYGVGKLAQTPVGQSVVGAIKKFSDAHPELSKDIGAGFNVITAIPILDGLNAVKGFAGDAVSQALKGVAEKSMTNDLSATLERTVGGRKILGDTPEVVKTIVDERAIPSVNGTNYSTGNADAKLDAAISKIDKGELQPILDRISKSDFTVNGEGQAVPNRINLSDYRNQALSEAKDELISPNAVNEMFDRIEAKYGKNPTIDEMNKAKRLVAKRISETAFGSPDATPLKMVRNSLQKSVEEGAAKLGNKDIDAINQKMARLIKAQKALRYIENKPVRTGFVGGVIKDAAAGAGELAGNSAGLPIIGTLAGREAGGYAGKKLAGITEGILNRTGKDAAETVSKDALKAKGKKLVAGALAQKASR